MSLPPDETERWIRVRSVVAPAVRSLVEREASDPTEAVETVKPGLSRSERADATMLVEMTVDRLRDKADSLGVDLHEVESLSELDDLDQQGRGER